MSLRRHSSSAFRFNSEIMASRKIILDLETFQTFFDSYADELRRGGLKSNSNSKASAQATGTVPLFPSLLPLCYVYLCIVSFHFPSWLAQQCSRIVMLFFWCPGNSAASEELEPIANLARIVSATHITGKCNNSNMLCSRTYMPAFWLQILRRQEEPFMVPSDPLTLASHSYTIILEIITILKKINNHLTLLWIRPYSNLSYLRRNASLLLRVGVTNDVNDLFARYGADGLKLVHAAFSCNPSLSRNSRLESVEAANKLFEAGGPKGKYPSALSDLYRGVTDLITDNNGKQKAAPKTKSKPKSRFFGWCSCDKCTALFKSNDKDKGDGKSYHPARGAILNVSIMIK